MYKKFKINESTCRICFKKREPGYLFITWLFFDDTLCSECRKRLKGRFKTIHRLDMEVYSIYPYKDFSRDILLRFKDSKDRWLSDVFFSPFLFSFYKNFYKCKIVYIPSHISQSNKRGYIPNEELISNLRLPLIKDVLFKKYPYKQSTMHRETRENIRSVIDIKNIESLRDEHILIFDDLVTTGNSLKACHDLIKPYAKSVKVFALFHHEI